MQRHHFGTHPPADRILRIAEDIGGQVTLFRGQTPHQSGSHRRRQFLEQRHSVIGLEVCEGDCHFFVLQRTDQVLLQDWMQFLENP